MSLAGVTFITYLWHYLAARTLYDHVIRPLLHGDASGALLVGVVGVAGFVLGRWTSGSTRRRA